MIWYDVNRKHGIYCVYIYGYLTAPEHKNVGGGAQNPENVGGVNGSRDLLIFFDPIYISGTAEPSNFKLDWPQGVLSKSAKLG